MPDLVSNKTFSISDLEKFSGIKAHTIRVWEQRHQVFSPSRNNGIRQYEINELDKMLKLALLNKNGYRISYLSQLDNNELEVKLLTLHLPEDQQERIVCQLLVHMYALKPVQFETLLQSALQYWCLDEVITKIIYPFLQRTELLWIGHRLSEEHFVVPILRKKIIQGIEGLEPAFNNQKKILLFLPEGRQLDLGLLYANYLLKQKGINVLYMGTDVSVKNLEQTFKITTPHVVFTYLPQKNNFTINSIAMYMQQTLPHSKLLIGEYESDCTKITYSNTLILHFTDALNWMLAQEFEVVNHHNHSTPEVLLRETVNLQ